jgi:uncharacterized protein (DUF2141 family)
VPIVFALAGWLAAAEPAPPAPASAVRRIGVMVGGFRNRAGVLRLKVVSEGAGFPGSDEHVVAKRRLAIDADPMRVAFAGLAPGDYAVVALHDEDDDGELDRWLGFPNEGVGFSGGARIRFGPPSFEDARLVLEDGSDAEVTIEMQYR